MLPPVDEKASYVAAMFDRIAPWYDRMNTLMTLGLDAGWRRAVVNAAHVPVGGRVLDVGSGTGKLARALAEQSPAAAVVGVDFSRRMLAAGQGDSNRDGSVRVLCVAADAERLPFADATFDAVMSGFLVRNLAHLALGLEEQARVLRPGGWLVVLETTPGPPGPLGRLFRLAFGSLVPLLGGLLARDAVAYRYLPASSASFLEPADLADRLGSAGVEGLVVRRLGLGSVALISGRRPSTPPGGRR